MPLQGFYLVSNGQMVIDGLGGGMREGLRLHGCRVVGWGDKGVFFVFCFWGKDIGMWGPSSMGIILKYGMAIEAYGTVAYEYR